MLLSKNQKTVNIVGVALLTALIIVLQWLSSVVTTPLGFTISLVLIPILIGAVMFGWKAAAFLGFIAGAWILVLSFLGLEPSGVFFLGVNAPMTVLTILLKGTLSGLIPGLLYSVMKNKINNIAATAITGGLIAVINTGVFLIFALTVFRDSLSIEAGFAKGVSYVIASILGINFTAEFLSTAIIGTILCKVLGKAVKR